MTYNILFDQHIASDVSMTRLEIRERALTHPRVVGETAVSVQTV